MLAEIITIGDEILIGQIVDTNSAWIAKKLNEIGIEVKQISSVSDSREHIINALREAESRADIVLITGGLGPTKDDITKKTLCEYFNASLRFDDDVYKNIKALFSGFGLKVTELNRMQAEVPDNCTVIHNANGTAPGMWFSPKGRAVFISMPGVPYEMMSMMENEVLPKLTKRFKTPAIVHRTVLTQGIGESFLSEKISDWENRLGEENIKLAYLPSPGIVRLRLSAKGEDKKNLTEKVTKKTEELHAIIPGYIFGYDDDELESIIGKLLIERGQTLSTAESCTGGYIAHRITSVSGSSAYYKGSVVSYSNRIKISSLGVSEKTLSKYGAVSEQVAREMAEGVQKKLETDFAIACTGIAGPEGGTAEKPVGTVWIAIATPDKVKTKKFLFGDNRARNIHITAITALNMLRKEIINSKE